MPGAVMLAVTAANRWLVTFSLVAVAVVVAGMLLRRIAQTSGTRRTGHISSNRARDIRRRGGVLLAIGPLVGLAFTRSPDTLVALAAVGAAAIGAIGAIAERWTHADRVTRGAVAVGAVVAAAGGARFGPTGVPALDVALSVVFIVAVTEAFDGFGNADGLVCGVGGATAAGLFAIAAFGRQDDLATVALGLTSACIAFLAFNLPPASLFVGRAGRLTVGYALAVGALALDSVPGPGRSVAVPPMLVGVALLDVGLVASDRLRRRRRLTAHRADHITHRLAALGWSRSEALTLLVATQLLVSLVTLFTARAVIPVWFGAAFVVVVIALLGVEAMRGHVDHDRPPRLDRRAWLVVAGAIALAAIVIVPTAVAANDAAGLMLEGRDAASRGLAAARDGNTITAEHAFARAAITFGKARDQLESPMLAASLAIPGVASNLRAARALASIGADLARAGLSVSTSVDPDALEVVDGRLPVEEVVKLTPELDKGSAVLTRALRQLDEVRDEPYLASSVESAIDTVHVQLVQAEREARHAADAAHLAPAIFGGDGTRRYLLVVQNNAESRATGGFIGSFGTITAEDGKLTVSEIERTGVWNASLRDRTSIVWSARADYKSRYGQFKPETNLQNVNLTPDFPAVARVLMSLAPQAGVGTVDGVISVDPAGLAALLSLTGPITVPQWPTEISSANVVDVTLRDAYATLGTEAQTEARVDFLGDVARASIDAATTGSLGRPASIAQALGAAAHEGHLVLAFARPAEQRLAEELDAAGHVRAVRSDSLAVTTSNFAANKIDYYLDRTIDYRVKLRPDPTGDRAQVTSELDVDLANTAPLSGLPQIVIGPFDSRFIAGLNRTFLSLYSPLAFGTTAWNDEPTAVTPGTELDRNVLSMVRDLPSATDGKLTTRLMGDVALHEGWYQLEVVHQPTLNDDRVRVSVEVPEGWRIDRTRGGMRATFGRAAVHRFVLDRTTTMGVHVVRDPDPWDLWARLEAGR